MSKKILSIIFSVVICFSIFPSRINAQDFLLINQYEDTLNKIANLLNDSKQDANQAVDNWLNNESGKYYFSDFEFNTDKCVYEGNAYHYYVDDSIGTEEWEVTYNTSDEIIRMAKDNLYILSLTFQYLSNYTYKIDHSDFPDPWGGYNSYVDDIRCFLDHMTEVKEKISNIVTQIGLNEYDETFIESFVVLSKKMLETISDTYSYYGIDKTKFFNDMKKDIVETKENEDPSNSYLKYKTYFNGFVALTLNPLGFDTLDKNYDSLLNDVNNYYFNYCDDFTGYLSNIENDYKDIDFNDNEEAKIEFLNKMYKFSIEMIYTYLEKFSIGIDNSQDKGIRIDAINCVVNNCWPVLYKTLDLLAAFKEQDPPNILILNGEIADDLSNLYNLTFGDVENPLFNLEYAKNYSILRFYAANATLNNAQTNKALEKYVEKINNANTINDVVNLCNEGIMVINTIVEDDLSKVDIDVDLISAGRTIDKTYEDVVLKCNDNHDDSVNKEITKYVKKKYNNRNSIYVFDIEAKKYSKYKSDENIYDYGNDNPLEVELHLKREFKNLTLLRFYNGNIEEIPYGYDSRNNNSEFFEMKNGKIIANLRYLGTYCIAYKKDSVYVSPKTGVK